LFEGRAADVVETALEQVLARSREGRETARKRRDEVAQAMSSLDGALSSQIEILSSQQAAAQQAESELEALLREHQVTLAQLRDILAHEQQWVEQERLALEQIEEARQAAFGLLQERTRKCAEQRAAEPPEWPLQTVLDGLRNIAAELNEAREAWAGLHGRQSEDERRKLAVKSLQAELDQQRERQQIWASLNQLIGSADGAKFRSFAQGLTLELLVEHANVHLQDLARRYLLQRAPGSEMELQVVDREMGDEVRGVHSLSGGESFLLSLALALGLASLASDRVQVESLFIDEGFGALDADSLDMAIASLDALYSLGRQVGVISHVGALVERIGIKVEVAKQGGGRSRLAVLAG
jgi:exonuclease SbcC